MKPGRQSVSLLNRTLRYDASAKSTINRLILEAGKTALAEVERLARKILTKHANLDEFVMGMGTAFFTVKGSDENLGLEDRKYFKPLRDLIFNFDDTLGLTGEPMRFTATDKKVTNW